MAYPNVEMGAGDLWEYGGVVLHSADSLLICNG